MRELFIYYRAKTENADALQARVLALQAELQGRHPGLLARLMCRPEASDGMHTWMETYALTSHLHGVPQSLQREIENAALNAIGPLIAGARHSESFIPCA